MKAIGPTEIGRQNRARPVAEPLSSGTWLLCLMLALLPAFAVHGGTGQADSPDFSLDTRFVVATASCDSGSFRLNTRFSPSTGAGMSRGFELDTRPTPDTVASMSGQVTDANGQPLAGATIVAEQGSGRPAGTQTDGAGGFQLAGLAPGTWQVWVSRSGYRTWVQRGVRLAGGEARTLNVALDPMPALPNVTSSERPVETTQEAEIVTPDSTALQVFEGSTFTSGGIVDRALPTVIFTHGWDSGPEVWAQAMAAQMRSAGIQANLLAWNWKTEADTLEPVAAMSRTRSQGEALGRALAEALGDSYTHTLHFIGHSLGTLVNATAADRLHDLRGNGNGVAPFPADHTQMTLLDDAGVVSKAGKVLTFDYKVSGLNGSIASQVVQAGYVSPVPEDAAWIDNYISLVGNRHQEAVNVYLPKSLGTGVVTAMHAYACDWYAGSVGPAGAQALVGERYGFERSGWPGQFPTPVPFALGASLSQDPLSDSSFDLLPLTEAQRQAVAVAIRGVGVTGGLVTWAHAATVDWAEAKLERVGSAAVTWVQSVFRPDPATTPAAPRTDDLLTTSGAFLPLSPRIELTTAASTLPRRLSGPGPAGEPTAADTAPAVWMTLTLPAEVRGISFDFTLAGGVGSDDYLAFGIDGTNRFALETRFMETNRSLSSGWIDVSDYAGQSVEFFFGVLGGTSTNLTVAVDGLRFYQAVAPQLRLARSGSDVVLRWPVGYGPFILETAATLAPAPDWSPLNATPALDGGFLSVTNAVTDSTRFFRLRQDW